MSSNTKVIFFYFNEKKFSALEGFTIGEALLYNNIHTFSRSIKYHRPRGYFCGTGQCNHCAVEVDGVGSVKACITPLKEGMKIHSQNHYPSLNFDLMRVSDFVFKPYLDSARMKLFRGKLSPVSMRFLKKYVGVATLPNDNRDKVDNNIEQLTTDVLVIGLGKYGMESAIVAGEFGANVIGIDSLPNIAMNDERLLALEKNKKIKIFSNTSAVYIEKKDVWKIGCYKDDKQYIEIYANSLIISTGRNYTVPPYENADLPGVYTFKAFKNLIIHKAISPKNVVIDSVYLNDDDVSFLDKNRLNYTFIVRENYPKVLEKFGKIVNSKIVKLKGFSRVNEVIMDSGMHIKLDAFISTSFYPSSGILFNLGCEMDYIDNVGFVPKISKYLECSKDNVFVSGYCGGVFKDLLKAAKIAGINAAVKGHKSSYSLREYTEGYADVFTNGYIGELSNRMFICTCEDVTYKELEKSIKEGYTDIEKMKRYTGIGTGMCQGKSCMMNAVKYMKNNNIEAKMTTQRPPVMTVKLGSLVGDKDEKN
ncbi:MAG: 2Fe-2S iron-sulfur cluster-binding protein [Thermoplasmata archaeon]